MKTKRDFLLQLRYYMTFRCSFREIRDTLEDFNGFFETGLSEGKTEEELCHSFGRPKEIVRQLTCSAKAGRQKFSLHMIFQLSLAFCTFLFAFWVSVNSYRFASLPVLPACAAVLASAAILLSESRTFPANLGLSALWSGTFPIQQIFSCALAGFLTFFLWKSIDRLSELLPSPALGTAARNICLLFMISGLALLLWSGYAFFHGASLSLGPALQGVGLLASSWLCLDFLHRLDMRLTPPYLWLLPLGLSFLISIFYYLAVKFSDFHQNKSKKRPRH